MTSNCYPKEMLVIDVLHVDRDGDYSKVATLGFTNQPITDIEALELAFRYTNTIDIGWYACEGAQTPSIFLEVDTHAKLGCRSTSVGDMALVRDSTGNRVYGCASLGWKQVYPARG